MENNETPLFEYPFALNRTFGIVGILIVSLLSIGSFFFGAVKQEPILLIFAGVCSVTVWSIYRSITSKKTIKVFKDRVEIPDGIRGKKVHSLDFSEIISVEEVSINGPNVIKINRKAGRPILIEGNFIREDDYYNLYEHLQKHESKHSQLNPVSLDKEKRKVLIYTLLASTVPFFFFLGSAFFTGKLNDPEELNKFGYMSLVILILNFLVVCYYRQREKQTKELKSNLSLREIKKLKNKWVLIVLIPSLLMIVVAAFLLNSNHFETIDLLLITIYAIISSASTVFLITRFLPNTAGVMTAIEKQLMLGTSFIFSMFFFAALFLALNINMDNSDPFIKESYLTEMYLPDKRTHEKCFKVAHWETGEVITFDHERLCSFTYPGLKEKDKVRLLVRKGAFGASWISEIKFPKYESVDSFMKDVKDDLELRSLDIDFMVNIHGKSVWNKYAKKWEKECNKSHLGYCRLTSYILRLDGKTTNAFELLRKGCAKRDFLSCYGLFFYVESKKDDLKAAKDTMLKICKDEQSADQLTCKAVAGFRLEVIK